MNSIVSALSADTIKATLKLIRSSRRHIILLVEGDADISLFSSVLGLPSWAFVSCWGKERLMAVYGSAPATPVDIGMIFVRDADFDNVGHQDKDGVRLFVSDRYDFEMSLVVGRVYRRILVEFLRERANETVIEESYTAILRATATLGSLRKYAAESGVPLDFSEMKLNFIDAADMTVNVPAMIRYVLARSRINGDIADIEQQLEATIEASPDLERLCCGKDFLKIFSIALGRRYRACKVTECSFEILARIQRIAVVLDDFRALSFWQPFAERVVSSGFEWSGVALEG